MTNKDVRDALEHFMRDFDPEVQFDALFEWIGNCKRIDVNHQLVLLLMIIDRQLIRPDGLQQRVMLSHHGDLIAMIGEAFFKYPTDAFGEVSILSDDDRFLFSAALAIVSTPRGSSSSTAALNLRVVDQDNGEMVIYSFFGGNINVMLGKPKPEPNLLKKLDS